MADYPVENLLREPTEIYTSITCLALALLAINKPHLFLLTQSMSHYAGFSLSSLALYRGIQALKIKRFHRRLITMPYYALSTKQVPLSEKWLFIGRGFRWFPHHTQRLNQIKQIKNEAFMQQGKIYQTVRTYCQNHESTYLARLFNANSRLNPFKPDPPVGGSPYLHGLGEQDKPVYIPQDVRVGHTFVVGTTRVGKTRLASILINQDIRNGAAIIVVDPKGDLDLVRDMYSACNAANRLNDFRIVHLGFPELSAHYNPLKNFDQVSEVATRITDAIAAEGEGKQFAAFAWKYIKEHISKTITEGRVESLHDQVLIDLFDAAIMDKSYYDKITASVGPVLSEINKSNASSIFSFHKSPCEIELMAAIKQKKVIYIGLDSLTNPNIAQAVGKAFLSDLVSTAGKIYKESNANYRLNLHCDELSEIIQDSFVKILNKAGGAGFQVTAYAQTKQDMEVALGSRAKAEVTEGNLNTLIMLRVKNEETANLLVKVLPQIGVIGHTQVSMVNDTPHFDDGVYFNTTNEDRVQTTSVPMIEVNDIISLPKGQAFVLVNGGELYKVRVPLPLNDELAPKDIKSVIREINQLKPIGETML